MRRPPFVATLKVRKICVMYELEESRLCAVSYSFIWDEEKTQEDEGCQLEDNAGQIDTTLQHLRYPIGFGYA